MTIYGPNREVIRELVKDKPRKEGHNVEVWDGRDVDGNIVPDEAYFFAISATAEKKTAVYDPLVHSGGEWVSPRELQWMPEHRLVSYTLPKAARVILRAGVKDGPLAATVVNWEPRARGACTEQWDGRDSDGVRKLDPDGGGQVSIGAFALPENSIITYGNMATSYREYYLTTGKFRSHKPTVPRDIPQETMISPYSVIPKQLNKDVSIRLQFPPGQPDDASGKGNAQSANTVANALQRPSVPTRLSGDSTILRIDIPDETERKFMTDQRFELLIYVDEQLVIEAEQGHMPFNWRWDLSALASGTHVLTVNVASFRGNVGTASRSVEVVRDVEKSVPTSQGKK